MTSKKSSRRGSSRRSRASRRHGNSTLNADERAQKRKGLCVWQTGYGLPHVTYCKRKATHGMHCKEHWEDSLVQQFAGRYAVFVGGKGGKVVNTVLLNDHILDEKGKERRADDITRGHLARRL